MDLRSRRYCLFGSIEIEISLEDQYWRYIDWLDEQNLQVQFFIENCYIYRKEHENFDHKLSDWLLFLYYEFMDDHHYQMQSFFSPPPPNHPYR